MGDMTNSSADDPPNADRSDREAARASMLARHRLIEAIIRNNEAQLRNDSARGGAEIEMHCALRDARSPNSGDEAAADVERLTARFKALQDEHDRLVAEREWLNASLLEFDDGPQGAGTHYRSGNA
ncbi:hypothetical protein [Rhodopseudomonas sp. B29]|uniref:hypothetical protein n=1 Tax=Rhodopseudomonas sp. B29 TaxID=95607 RepID=UPI000348C4F3|nr:hypothetical protein [Rhodopseudomonas sp. B29]